MNRAEAEAYLRQVHNKVDGVKTIKILGFDFKVADLDVLKSELRGEPVMPDYDHEKYLKAKEVTSITGKVMEPFEALKNILFGRE